MKSNLFLVLVQFHLFTGYACRGLTPSNLDQCSWCKMVQLTLHLIGLCAETVHLALQSGVSGAAELCSVCRTPPPSPPCRQERYEAATVAMVFQGEHILQSVSPHHSILGSKNELSFASQLTWYCSIGLSDTRQKQPCWVTGGGSVTKFWWPQRDRPWPFWLHLSTRLANL